MGLCELDCIVMIDVLVVVGGWCGVVLSFSEEGNLRVRRYSGLQKTLGALLNTRVLPSHATPIRQARFLLPSL